MQKLIDWALSLYIFFSLIIVFLFSNIFSESDVITYENTLFSVFIISLISFLSYISTWRKLNAYYATKLESPSIVKIFRSGSIGSISYGNCLKIGVLDNGIYLSNLLNILAIFNKPLLIPWSDITEVYTSGNDRYKIKIKTTDFLTTISLPVDSLKDAEEILKVKMK